MATLEEMREKYLNDIASVTHLLLIGPTKAGKSSYVAQAARDGYSIIYVENDNGLATLLNDLKDEPEALKRVHYFNPIDFVQFVDDFCMKGSIRYNNRTRTMWTSMGAKPDDSVTVLYPARMPRSVIFSIDSWTTLMHAIVKAKAAKEGINLMDIDKHSREIYGGCGFRGTQLAQMIQLCPVNTIVQAHPGVYEIKEKPPGVVKEVKENEMIIKSTWDIPKSISNPHGHGIGQYFNQIGWLGIGRFDKYELDFTAKQFRVGGGTPNSKGDPRTTHRFKKLFGVPGEIDAAIDPDRPWIENITSAEMSERLKPKAPPPKPAGAATPTLAAKPTAPVNPGVKLGGLKFGS